MSNVTCLRCGLVNDYHTVISGPHVKAICNGCNRYIKFLSHNELKPKKMDNQTSNQNRPMPQGVRLFDKHQSAPDFVLGTIVITPRELIQFLKENPNYLSEYNGKKQLRLQMLRSREGKLYSVVDLYGTPAQPKAQTTTKEAAPVDDGEDDLPF